MTHFNNVKISSSMDNIYNKSQKTRNKNNFEKDSSPVRLIKRIREKFSLKLLIDFLYFKF